MSFERGNGAAVTHGATSEGRVVPLARLQRRRVLRSLGLRLGDLDPIGRGYLDAYTRLTAKIELADRYIAEHGMLKPNGEPVPVMRLYVSLANAARLTLARLEDHLHARHADPHAALNAYLEGRDGS